MKLLLIAHEFPPIPSPQSLRWAYLAGELARRGHEIAVLCPDHPGYGPPGGLPDLPDSIRIIRTYPGPFAAHVLRRRRHVRPPAQSGGQAACSETEAPGQQAIASSGLNWKGRLVERFRAVYAAPLFPDVRAEWNPWARRALRSVLPRFLPDAVIASHEPASCLGLGLLAESLGFPLVADLGDPVCASYTPKRWRRHALTLESEVCRRASCVVVTAAGARDLLFQRHEAQAPHIAVVPQGHPAHAGRMRPQESSERPAGAMEFLYTGSFYDFRQAGGLVEAAVRTSGVCLNVATPQAPGYLIDAARRHPESVRILGLFNHADALRAQARADILINISNQNPEQIPGKLYEYLGAGRPIVHITARPDIDPAADLLDKSGAGLVCRDDADTLSDCFSSIVDARRTGDSLFPVRNETVIRNYRWPMLAQQYEETIKIALASKRTQHV